MKRILCLFLALNLLAGCASIFGGGITLAQSSKPRNTSPVSSAEDQSKLVADNTGFAFDLYKLLKARPGNLFLSPYSISSALAISQVGARGQTLAQMNQALHFSLPFEALHPTFNALQLSLNQREKNDRDASKKDFTLKTVNALWGEKTYTFKPEYLDFLAENYGLGLRLVDFKENFEASRQAINRWVTNETEQRIKDLFPSNSFDKFTTLVVANAIYFNADWKTHFPSRNTKPGDFTLLDGNKIQVPMMSIGEKFNYIQGSNYQAVELPYEGDKLSMLIVVPDAGKFSEVENAFNAGELGKVRNGTIPPEVKLQMPKFTFESSLNLEVPLKNLGMTDAFNKEIADFSGMDGTRYIYISQVEHKTFIKVNEKGTEAAAATGVQFKNVSNPIRIVDLKIDRPFIFFILDKQSGALLFMGRLVDPR